MESYDYTYRLNMTSGMLHMQPTFMLFDCCNEIKKLVPEASVVLKNPDDFSVIFDNNLRITSVSSRFVNTEVRLTLSIPSNVPDDIKEQCRRKMDACLGKIINEFRSYKTLAESMREWI